MKRWNGRIPPDAGILGKVVERLRTELGGRLSCVVLFGSRARLEPREGSDWDFLVLLRNRAVRHVVEEGIGRVEETAACDAVLSVAEEEDVEVSMIALSADDFERKVQSGLPLFRAILRDGVVLYQASEEGERVA